MCRARHMQKLTNFPCVGFGAIPHGIPALGSGAHCGPITSTGSVTMADQNPLQHQAVPGSLLGNAIILEANGGGPGRGMAPIRQASPSPMIPLSQQLQQAQLHQTQQTRPQPLVQLINGGNQHVLQSALGPRTQIDPRFIGQIQQPQQQPMFVNQGNAGLQLQQQIVVNPGGGYSLRPVLTSNTAAQIRPVARMPKLGTVQVREQT